MKLVKELTTIYISLIRRPVHQRVPDALLEYVKDALIEAQKLLTHEQKSNYEKWHRKMWPNLDW